MEFLTHAEAEALRKIPNKPLQSFNGLEAFKSFDELKRKNEIRHNLIVENDYEKILLFILDKDRILLWYKVLSNYTILFVILFMIIFPIIVSNYWLYLFLILIPISAFTISPAPSIFKPLFWLIIIGAIGYSVYTGHLEILGMILPVLLLKFSTTYARKLFQQEILKEANQVELAFKWLYARGSILLMDKDTGELTYMDMK